MEMTALTSQQRLTGCWLYGGMSLQRISFIWNGIVLEQSS